MCREKHGNGECVEIFLYHFPKFLLIKVGMCQNLSLADILPYIVSGHDADILMPM